MKYIECGNKLQIHKTSQVMQRCFSITKTYSILYILYYNKLFVDHNIPQNTTMVLLILSLLRIFFKGDTTTIGVTLILNRKVYFFDKYVL